MVLYLVATPIGNLKDITLRAIDTLKSCDYILCEDTRHSLTLLNHYDIKRPVLSYHKFNEKEREKKLLEDLSKGKQIALISDAGTPTIADPGMNLVATCRHHGYQVIGIPGACSLIQGLIASGFNTERFQFIGFLPKPEQQLKQTLIDCLQYSGTTISYESSRRIEKTLTLLHTLAPDSDVAIARELTKKFEEYQKGNVKEMLDKLIENPIKGEIVLLIAPRLNVQNDWQQIDPLEHVLFLETTYAISRMEAIKLTANMRGVPKREIYEATIS